MMEVLDGGTLWFIVRWFKLTLSSKTLMFSQTGRRITNEAIVTILYKSSMLSHSSSQLGRAKFLGSLFLFPVLNIRPSGSKYSA
jgi:hypothetical protein